ncbi:MAG: hypothetical protein ABMA02_13110 [Saprospiraceae bacterium]
MDKYKSSAVGTTLAKPIKAKPDVYITKTNPVLNPKVELIRDNFNIISVLTTRLYMVARVGLESLPVLPCRPEGYYEDNNDANRKWYFPDIVQKSPVEGGFRFVCYKDGIGADGKDVYKANLVLGFRLAVPDAIQKLKEIPGNTAAFAQIPVTYLNGTIVLKVENRDVPVPVSTNLDPAKPDFEIAVPIPKESLGLWYRTIKDADIGAPLAMEAQFLAWERPSTPHQINLLDNASSARWSSGTLTDADNTTGTAMIPFQGSDGDSRGFVRIDTAYCEDGKAYRALRMHPKWAERGSIKGYFPDKTMPKNARFEAKIGFLKGAVHTDGVTFQVWEHHYDSEQKRRVWNKVAEKIKPYNGKLTSLKASLSHLAGQNVGIELRVDAGASSGQDWAAWIEPRVVGDELTRKTVSERRSFKLSYPCSRHPEFFQFQKPDGTSVSFGCTPPWDADYTPDAPYTEYNKVNLTDLGVAKVFKSILRDDQFLLVPSKYVIARDASRLPEIFVSVLADLNNESNSKALFDAKLAPDISDAQMIRIKKRLVQSWEGADISATIDLAFPGQVAEVRNENPEITPVVKLAADENYAHGPGTALNLSLENLSLANASLLMLNIAEAAGRSFNFRVRPGGNLAPVPSVAAVSLNDLTGSFVYAVRDGNSLQLANLLDRAVTVSKVVADTNGRADNPAVSVNKTIEGGGTLALELPEPMRSGIEFAAEYTVGTGPEYAVRESNVTTDNVRQDFTVDCGAVFQDPDAHTVELSVQMKDSANNVVEVFTGTRKTGIVTLRLPIGFYLASRVVDYALRITYRDPAKAEQTRTGKINLRENSLLEIA